jgi:phosphatidylserine/phosphatidylglycerophosphate/cardiolipin synthase-like enzyme
MIKNKEISEGEFYIGRYAGKEIHDTIISAKKSIKIITPYMSGTFVDLLKKKVNQGLDVKLVVSSDIGGQREKLSTLFKLINQKRHTNEELKTKRDKWLKIANYSLPVLLFVITILAALQFYEILFLAILLPVIVLVKRHFNKLVIYSYSYDSDLSLSITMSPYSNGFDKKQTLTHAKMYIIDDVAYVGSLNFTKSAFWKNYESRVKLTNQEFIYDLEKEFNYVFNSHDFNYLDISRTGSQIYKELPN